MLAAGKIREGATGITEEALLKIHGVGRVVAEVISRHLPSIPGLSLSTATYGDGYRLFYELQHLQPDKASIRERLLSMFGTRPEDMK